MYKNLIISSSPTGPWKNIATRLAAAGHTISMVILSSCAQAKHEMSIKETLTPDYLESLGSKSASLASYSGLDIATYYKILDRVDGNENLFLDIRNKILLRYLGAWENYIEKNKIDFVIFSNTPHLIYDYPLYMVAKSRNIPCLMGVRGPSLDFLGFSEHPTGPLLSTPSSLQPSSNILEETLVHPFLGDKKLWYMSLQEQPKNTIKRSLKRFIKSIIKPQKFNFDNKLAGLHESGSYNPQNSTIKKQRRILNIITRKNRRMQKTYKNLAIDKLPETFVYFPLHYQPEATTTPMCGDMGNQLYTLDTIARAWPHITIAVKEHPTTFNTGFFGPCGRPTGFYENLVQYPNVVLLDMSIDSRSIIKKSTLALAGGGTAIWEFILQEKPARYIGWSWMADYHKNHLSLEKLKTTDPSRISFIPKSKEETLNHLQKRLISLKIEENDKRENDDALYNAVNYFLNKIPNQIAM